MTQSPGASATWSSSSNKRGRRIDAQHGGLREVEARRHRDHVGGPHPAPLRPILALHVDDEVARLDAR